MGCSDSKTSANIKENNDREGNLSNIKENIEEENKEEEKEKDEEREKEKEDNNNIPEEEEESNNSNSEIGKLLYIFLLPI